jgi:hypothetical protein
MDMIMKKWSSITVLMFLLSITHFSIAQRYMTNPQLGDFKALSTPTRLGRAATEVIDGSPYSSDDYQIGVFHLKNGGAAEVEMKYNIYLDQIEYKKNDSSYTVRPNSIIKKISTEDNTFVVEPYQENGNNRSGFFVRLDSGEASLLVKMKVTIKNREEATPMKPEITPAQYKRMLDECYIKIGDSHPVKLKNTKGILESIPDHKEKVKSFIKSNKISARDPEELTALIQYYNSLSS